MPLCSYVVQASPLSKLFMHGWAEKLEANPELIFDPTPFEVSIPKTNGAIKLTHNKPVHITKLEPPQPSRIKDEYNVDDLEGMVLWLIGGEDGERNEETDIYGVVGLNLDMDVSGALADVALFDPESKDDKNKAAKKFAEIQNELVKKTKGALDVAKEKADWRVKRAMRNTHLNLMKQYETLKTEGKGVYAPSVAEAIGAFVLKSEIDRSSQNRRKMVEMLANTMNETTILR